MIPTVLARIQIMGRLVSLAPVKKQNVLNLLGALAVGSALNLQLSTAFAQGTGFTLLTTFTNPTPAANDDFGASVTAVGSDRVLIGACLDDTGATDAGAAYLFSTNGALLTTFTNPTPAVDDWFGLSVAAVGTDRVLIGAIGDETDGWRTGSAYLFSTDGTLLTTFANPTPAASDNFSWSVAAIGDDRVLIGARGDNAGAPMAGAAYLFRTNGALLVTFTNPTPAAYDYFGRSVAAVGADRVLIGAVGATSGAGWGTGAVYLFSTNGALLTTFTNPTPVANDYFGCSVAAVGSDRVLIGACWDEIDGNTKGAAYLFRTNGVLLTTFTKPKQANGGWFGYSVAAAGSDRVLIGGPYDSTDTEGAGAVYLFSTDGTLLNTFTNPTPAAYDNFGCSVAAVGTNRVLMGTLYDDAGATDAGAVYLFSLAEQSPAGASLAIHLTTTNTVAVSWPSPSTGWALQENTNGVASVNWSNAPGLIQDDGTTKTLIVTPSAENRFYRLFKP